VTERERTIRRHTRPDKIRLPVWTPDSLWVKVVDGKMDARALVIALLRARSRWLVEVSVDMAAYMIGLSVRSFAGAFRALVESGHARGNLDGGVLRLSWVGQEVRRVREDTWQILQRDQLRGMPGAQLRSRLAAAIVAGRSVGLPGGWSIRGAAAAVHVDTRTVSRASRLAREADAPHQDPEGDSLPDPVRSLTSPIRHEPDPEPEATKFVPAWKLTDLLRGLAFAKRPVPIQRETKAPASVLAELEALGPLDRGTRWGEAAEIVFATGLHAGFTRAKIALCRALERAKGSLEDLRQVAMRLARNPRVKSVAAVLVTAEIGLWMARGGDVPARPQASNEVEKPDMAKETFWQMRERTKEAREAQLAKDRKEWDERDVRLAKPQVPAGRPGDWTAEQIEVLTSALRRDGGHPAWRVLTDYQAGKSMFEIEAAHKIDADQARIMIAAALRASRSLAEDPLPLA